MSNQPKFHYTDITNLPDSKFVSDTLNDLGEINSGIKALQQNTQKTLLKERNALWNNLDKELEKYRQQLQFENEKKKESETDFVEAEKELKEHLEIMTNMAQKIDDDNKKLMTTNQDLLIQFKSQDADRDLLLK